MADSGADITENHERDAQGADYVCPQCGPDPAGADAHAENHHTWPLPHDDDLRAFIRGHMDHLDSGIHDLQQRAERIEKHLEALTAELADAKPLLDKWRNSGLIKLASGRMPWERTS